MCQSCFNEDWELTDDVGRYRHEAVHTLADFLGNLPADRRAAIEQCYQLTVQHQQEPGWMGSRLMHCQIDDDNYDIGASRDLMTPAEEPLADAWDDLDWKERSIVVAWRRSYSPFQPDPDATSALPPERTGHLPAPPWDTPLVLRNGAGDVCATLHPTTTSDTSRDP